MTHGFSCEHCGRNETRQAERQCDHCGEGMCADCQYLHDAHERCPKEFPTDHLHPNYPENYGFEAHMCHPDGETYHCLLKGVSDFDKAAEYVKREEQEHNVVCISLSRWRRDRDPRGSFAATFAVHGRVLVVPKSEPARMCPALLEQCPHRCSPEQVSKCEEIAEKHE
jgi:hypothetical protein